MNAVARDRMMNKLKTRGHVVLVFRANGKEAVMKKRDVKIGATYVAKVSDRLTEVRITGESPHGGWDAVNAKTNRTVRIKSAQRLRRRVDAPGAKGGAKKPKGDKGAKKQTKRDTGKPSAPGAKRAATSKADAVDAAMKAVDADKKKRMSGLDAAAQVLKDAKGPLTTKEMVERMLARNLWKTGGKTPAATIYSAILREINTKGKDARFRKASRGEFELAK